MDIAPRVSEPFTVVCLRWVVCYVTCYMQKLTRYLYHASLSGFSDYCDTLHLRAHCVLIVIVTAATCRAVLMCPTLAAAAAAGRVQL
jgi:uncharacterized membrane protein YesL